MKKIFILRNEDGEILKSSERNMPNKMHFETQLNNHASKVCSKKTFKRSVEKNNLRSMLNDYDLDYDF